MRAARSLGLLAAVALCLSGTAGASHIQSMILEPSVGPLMEQAGEIQGLGETSVVEAQAITWAAYYDGLRALVDVSVVVQGVLDHARVLASQEVVRSQDQVKACPAGVLAPTVREPGPGRDTFSLVALPAYSTLQPALYEWIREPVLFAEGEGLCRLGQMGEARDVLFETLG